MRSLHRHRQVPESDRAAARRRDEAAAGLVDHGAAATRAQRTDDRGMSTAEYAVGTVAACGFAGLLFKVLTSDSVSRMLRDLVERALTTAF